MKPTIQIKLAAVALTAISISEFLEPYQLATEQTGNSIQIFRGKEVFPVTLPEESLTNEKAEETLVNLFNWIDPNDVDGVAIDWNLHVEREVAIAGAPVWQAPSEANEELDGRSQEVIDNLEMRGALAEA